MTEQEQKSILTIALMAAYADAGQDERERVELSRIAERLGGSGVDFTAMQRDVHLRLKSLPQVAADVQSPEGKTLAFELASAVCSADEATNEQEKAFLDALRDQLKLDPAKAAESQRQTETMANLPVVVAPADSAKIDDAAMDKMILDAAVLNGALELMPESLSTMAIIPLQMKMVYRVGQRYGFELDRGHIKDFLAVAGVGLVSQYVEGIARKVLGGVLGGLGGGLLGGLGKQATSSGMSFATTYALGHAAKQYYAGGRKFSSVELKGLFDKLMAEAKSMQERYAGDIKSKAGSMDKANIMSIVKNA